MDERLARSTWKEDHGLLPDDGGLPDSKPAASSKFTFDDVCYVLFRHKWKIVFFTLLGLVASGVLYRVSPRLYSSEAKLMVKYITELELPGGEKDAQARVPVMRGETVVNSELDIILSMDVAIKVAEAVGPQRILAGLGGGNDLISAALVVHGWTSADAPRRGNVIRVSFQHPDWRIVQPVLSNLVDQYFVKHAEIHKNLSSLDDFAQQREKIQTELNTTEQNLWQLRKTNGVFALDQAQKTAGEQVARIQQRLSDAETDLEARQAAMKSLQSSNSAPMVVSEEGLKEREARREQYRNVVSELERVRHQKLELAGQYSATSAMVRPLQNSINQLETKRRDLEKQDPNLLITSLAGTSPDGLDEASRITMMKANVEALNASLQRAKNEEARLYELATPIAQLQRNKELEENKYRNLSLALDNAQIDSGLGNSRFSNISRVQDPTPPSLDVGPLYKRMGMLAFGGLGLGVALALLMEFFVDQTVKRAVDFGRLVSLPLYMSIPKLRRHGAAAFPAPPAGLLADAPAGASKGGGRSKASDQPLQPYIEALRDRILNRFENLARKPKLVGVCGCVPGSGVTSIAAGLAASLSEAGDLKVLLVDMKRGNGRPHPILGGRKSLSLMEALEDHKRDEAQVAPNLYLATGGAANQQLVSSPRRFTTMVPQLNASDYDYIVFDMPPVNTVSITPRLAKHMDLTLLVVEAEKARRSTIQECGSLLSEFTENVAVVLNKTKSYLPRGIEQMG